MDPSELYRVDCIIIKSRKSANGIGGREGVLPFRCGGGVCVCVCMRSRFERLAAALVRRRCSPTLLHLRRRLRLRAVYLRFDICEYPFLARRDTIVFSSSDPIPSPHRTHESTNPFAVPVRDGKKNHCPHLHHFSKRSSDSAGG